MLTSPKVVETALEVSPAREASSTRDYGDRAPARGIFIGVAISVLIWAAIIAALI